jgi:hypothetical protein
LASWVDGIAHARYRDIDCSSYFARGGGVTFDKATVCVDLQACRGDGWVVAWVSDMVGRGRRVGTGRQWIARVSW